MSEIGDRLRKYRESIPKTLDELADETGIPKSSLGYYETKGQGIPLEAREKLKSYQAPVTWILTGEGIDPTLPIKEVPPGTIGGQGWTSLPEQRKAEAVRRALEEIERKGPTEAQVWAARQIAENALKGRKLFERASQEKKEFLVDWIAGQLALGSSPDVLERGVRLVLDGFEAADRQQGQ